VIRTFPIGCPSQIISPDTLAVGNVFNPSPHPEIIIQMKAKNKKKRIKAPVMSRKSIQQNRAQQNHRQQETKPVS
jgi:hypothetical protein